MSLYIYFFFCGKGLLFNLILNASLSHFSSNPSLLSAVPGAYLGVAGYRLPRQPHRETLCRCQGNLLLRLLTLSSPPEIQFERARTNLKDRREGGSWFLCGGAEGGGRKGDEEGKKMVRFLVIIFDGARKDVPNENLTLIRGKFFLSSPYH